MKKKTSITLEESLLATLKERAASGGVSCSAYIEDLIRKDLGEPPSNDGRGTGSRDLDVEERDFFNRCFETLFVRDQRLGGWATPASLREESRMITKFAAALPEKITLKNHDFDYNPREAFLKNIFLRLDLGSYDMTPVKTVYNLAVRLIIDGYHNDVAKGEYDPVENFPLKGEWLK